MRHPAASALEEACRTAWSSRIGRRRGVVVRRNFQRRVTEWRVWEAAEHVITWRARRVSSTVATQLAGQRRTAIGRIMTGSPRAGRAPAEETAVDQAQRRANSARSKRTGESAGKVRRNGLARSMLDEEPFSGRPAGTASPLRRTIEENHPRLVKSGRTPIARWRCRR